MRYTLIIFCLIGVLIFEAPIFLDPSYYGKLGFLALLLSIILLTNVDGKSVLVSSTVLGFGYLITGQSLNHSFMTIALFMVLYSQPKQNSFNWIFTSIALANVINLVIWALVSILQDSPSESWLYPSGHPNLFSSYLFLSSIIIIYAIQTEKNNKLGWIIVLVNLLVITIIGSKAIILAIAVGVFSFFMPWRKLKLFEIGNRARIIGLTIFLVIIFSALLPSILSSTMLQLEENESNTTIVERSILWRNSYNTMNRAAIIGKGTNSWPIEYLSQGYPKIYRARELNVLFQRPHNEFIRIYFEFGLLGLACLCFGLSYVLTRAYSLAKSDEILNIVFSGLVGFMVPLMVSFPLERVEHSVLLMILCLITLKHQNETV